MTLESSCFTILFACKAFNKQCDNSLSKWSSNWWHLSSNLCPAVWSLPSQSHSLCSLLLQNMKSAAATSTTWILLWEFKESGHSNHLAWCLSHDALHEHIIHIHTSLSLSWQPSFPHWGNLWGIHLVRTAFAISCCQHQTYWKTLVTMLNLFTCQTHTHTIWVMKILCWWFSGFSGKERDRKFGWFSPPFLFIFANKLCDLLVGPWASGYWVDLKGSQLGGWNTWCNSHLFLWPVQALYHISLIVC